MMSVTSAFVFVLFGYAFAQEESSGTATAGASCYGAGAIVATVILTLLIVGCLAATGYYAWIKYWKPKRERHLIFETDPERGKDEYAFDNPGFKDAGLSPVAASLQTKVDASNSKSRWTQWSQWSPLGVLTLKNEKRRTVDDNELKTSDVKIVALRSHDFTGLGFNICGNMKEGIFVKDLLHRGPALESGKLQTGDRIRSLTINFEHMVFEDALAILSYASPYDVVVEVQGHKNNVNSGPFGQPRHPLYKSASSTDLFQIKSARKNLFSSDDTSDMGSMTNLQKSSKNVPSLERKKSKSPKPIPPQHALRVNTSNNRSSKNIETTILEAPKPEKFVEESKQKTENTYQSKFGVKVLPMPDQIIPVSPKTFELSQNDNNINLEKTNDAVEPNHVTIMSIDEVDKRPTMPAPPPVKKREKFNKTIEPTKPEEEANFERRNSLNNSGIKRDENGIPQEIPVHMLNAAVAARKNRKSQVDDLTEDAKPQKKSKGKAPSPPDETKAQNGSQELARYNSDSDLEEMESKSSVNTIELNSSDITVHQSEEQSEEKQNRKTASTGDLTKIVKTAKPATGTLERAQSLDITDNSPMNGLSVKKTKNIDNFEPKPLSDVTLDDDCDELKLSTMLNGLNTFQRNRLKKSTEWGNLEDAISSFNNDDSKLDSDESFKISCENIDTKGEEINALVNKINEIKLENEENVNEEIEKVEKEASELKNDIIKIEQAIKESNISIVSNKIWPTDDEIEEIQPEALETIPGKSQVITFDSYGLNPSPIPVDQPIVEAHNTVIIEHKPEEIPEPPQQVNPPKVDTIFELEIPFAKVVTADFIMMEREACSKDPLPIMVTNVSDDMKVSMGSLERSPNVKELNNEDFDAVKEDLKDIVPKELLEILTKESEVVIPKEHHEVFTIESSEIFSREPEVVFTNDAKQHISNHLEANLSEHTKDIFPMELKEVPLKNTEERFPNNLAHDLANQSNEFSEVYLNEEEVIVPRVREVVEEFKITLPEHYNQRMVENLVEKINKLPLEDADILDDEIVDLSRINISNITIIDDQDDMNLYSTKKPDTFSVTHLNHDEKPIRLERDNTRILSTPDLIQNITIREAMNDVNNHVTIEGPTSLSFEITGKSDNPRKSSTEINTNGDSNSNENSDQDASKHSSLTYITEIQVTPMLKRNVSEIEIIRDKNLDSEFENYVKNFDIKSSSLDNLDLQPDSLSLVNNEVTVSLDSNLDIQKEISKIQEIADQQLKKLPEMRFSSSSYESQYNRDLPTPKRHSQIEILRSNFEKVNLPRHTKDPSPPKSRIPVALTTTKTPPTSPERRDSRTDLEPDKEIIEIMNNSNIPNYKYNATKPSNRNITVTSIRSNSKIPSGLPTFGNSAGVRPPVAPRKLLDNGDSQEGQGNVTVVTNGGGQESSSSFKQWVFNPNDGNGNHSSNTSVTNIMVTQQK